FTPAVARVKLWVGYGAISSGWSNPNQPVVLRLFSGPSGTGDTMAVATKTLVANARSFVPMVPLEACAQTAPVKSAKVSFLNAEGVSPTICNKDLVVDDLEYDAEVPPDFSGADYSSSFNSFVYYVANGPSLARAAGRPQVIIGGTPQSARDLPALDFNGDGKP